MFLIDPNYKILANITIKEVRDNLYLGVLVEDHLPEEVRKAFGDYEEIVTGQMFSFLEDIEARINSFNLAILPRRTNVQPLRIFDLQILRNGKVSFRTLTVESASTSVETSWFQQVPV